MQCDTTLLAMLQNPEKYPQDDFDDVVLSLISETRDAIARKRKSLGFADIGDEFVVGHLFRSKAPIAESDCRDFNRAVMSVMIEFLDWVSSAWKRPVKPVELLKNFLFDLGYTRLLSIDGSLRMRSHIWAGNLNFKDVESAYYYNYEPQRIYREALCIFGLRQTLEHKFSSLVGFVGSSPIVKIPHDFWPTILHKYVSAKKMRFADENVDIHRIMRVYGWTNDAIHGMRTDFVWSVWKAFQVCRPMFMPMTAGGVHSVVESASMSDADFVALREDALDEIAKRLVAEDVSCEIVFSKPELIVTDAAGHMTKRFDTEVRETINGHRKR